MKSKRIYCAFLAMALTAVGCAEKTAEPNETETNSIANISPRSITFEWQPLYEQKLSEYMTTEKFSDTAQNGKGESRFDLYDINADGTPELLISADDSHTTLCEIFTVSDGAVISVGELGEYGAFTFYPDFNLINDEYSGDGFVVGKFISFNGKTLSDSFSYSDNSSSASKGAVLKYEIDGEELSRPEYDEAMAVYKNARTISIGRKYSFGMGTIDYALHCSESWGAVLTPTEKELFRGQLTQNLATAVETGKNSAFEFCDLNNDEIPELIVSEGTGDEDSCRIYYISNNVLLELEGTFGYRGQLHFDNEQLVFYMTGSPTGNACWSLTANDISSFSVSRSNMECGRKYVLNENTINVSLR